MTDVFETRRRYGYARRGVARHDGPVAASKPATTKATSIPGRREAPNVMFGEPSDGLTPIIIDGRHIGFCKRISADGPKPWAVYDASTHYLGRARDRADAAVRLPLLIKMRGRG